MAQYWEYFAPAGKQQRKPEGMNVGQGVSHQAEVLCCCQVGVESNLLANDISRYGFTLHSSALWVGTFSVSRCHGHLGNHSRVSR